jgi:hypothetical protein
MIGSVMFPGIDGRQTVAVLDDQAEWSCPGRPDVVTVLSQRLADRMLTMGACGDPGAAAIVDAAGILKGTFILEAKPPLPAGSAY